jgi:hypothetical protein
MMSQLSNEGAPSSVLADGVFRPAIDGLSPARAADLSGPRARSFASRLRIGLGSANARRQELVQRHRPRIDPVHPRRELGDLARAVDELTPLQAAVGVVVHDHG